MTSEKAAVLLSLVVAGIPLAGTGAQQSAPVARGDSAAAPAEQPAAGGPSKSFAEFYGKWRGTGRMAPDFTAYDLDGKAVKLSDFRGKVVLLDFWFTTCHMCIKGFPGMHALAVKYADQGLVVIAAGTPEKREDFEAFVKANRDTYPRFVWLQDRSTTKFEEGVATRLYGMFGAPSQVIIDREGRAVWAATFKEQVLFGLPKAGIEVDAKDLAEAEPKFLDLEKRAVEAASGRN